MEGHSVLIEHPIYIYISSYLCCAAHNLAGGRRCVCVCGGDLTYAWRIPIGRPGLFMAMAFVIVSSVPCAVRTSKEAIFSFSWGGYKGCGGGSPAHCAGSRVRPRTGALRDGVPRGPDAVPFSCSCSEGGTMPIHRPHNAQLWCGQDWRRSLG